MSSRTKALIIGSVAGAALGVAAAWLFMRSVEEEAEEGRLHHGPSA
jgi:gas vesicle protein